MTEARSAARRRLSTAPPRNAETATIMVHDGWSQPAMPNTMERRKSAAMKAPIVPPATITSIARTEAKTVALIKTSNGLTACGAAASAAERSESAAAAR